MTEARIALILIAFPMIFWTILARVRWGHRWTTSVLLRRRFKRDPILGNLLHVLAFFLVSVLLNAPLFDVFLVWMIFVGLGHITW